MRKLTAVLISLLLAAPVWADNPISITVSAASLQAGTAGHAYWITSTGTLVDAGTNIAAATTPAPPTYWDVTNSAPSWAVDYGAQTGQVGCRLGVAELWPNVGAMESTTIAPYARDVAAHYIVTAGLNFTVQERLPSDTQIIYDVTSAANAALDTLALDTTDFGALYADALGSGGTTQLAPFEVREDGGYRAVATPPAAALAQQVTWAPGAAVATGATASQTAVPVAVQRLTRFTTTAAGVGFTVRLRVVGERRRPLRSVQRIAPYIQCATFPAAASPLYLNFWLTAR